ncbi:hypothetical protein BDN72DRAFT_862212 [Pluteus cervinus]|uniref:Uncharacterized protein n=1 Tax=Pluteus cervinus TaxID=181527 RepID=A0ACD3ACQ7_9AGAR|nr:hypothetical protein BDN72DRAFT_862212 [Pluteus cervinus]
MRFASYATIALSFVGAAVGVPAVKRASVSDLDTALSTLTSQISALDAALDAYPAAGDLLAASNINDQVLALGSTADNAAALAKALTTLSEADGQTIFVSMQNAVPQFEDYIQQLITKKTGFTSLPIPGIEGLVLQGLHGLANSVTILGSSLLAIAPADLQSPAQTLFQRITLAFAQVIMAYSS